MNEISLHCHLLYFSSIILSFGQCAFTQQGKTAREILRVVILCECNIYRRVCSLFSLAKCKVHHAFFTECATYISILEMGCNLNDVIY